jgi:integrase
MKLHRLTARQVQTAKTGMHGDGGGLWLAVTATSKSWVLRWMRDGKARAMGLGGFPAVSLEEARRKAAAARKQVAEGVDPIELKRAPKAPTFEQAARTLHAQLLPGWSNPKHGDDWINSLSMHAFGQLGHMQLATITPKHIADTLRPIWLTKAETARRVKQRTHAVMAWAWAHGHVDSNPVDVVDYLLPKQTDKAEHMPAMPWRDIPAWAERHLRGKCVSSRALAFLLLTAGRSGEVRGAEWAEFDLDAAVWTIPAERMKAKVPHRVPLCPKAVEIVRGQTGQHERLVFPSLRGKQLTDMALTQYLRKHQAHSDTPGRPATAHGFRSSFRDWASESGFARDLAERALAHAVENKVEAAYHRTDLLEQRRPMMVAWADMLAGKPGGAKVVPLRAA